MFKKYLETAIVEDIITPGSRPETFETVYPPIVPRQVQMFFEFMQTHIKLETTSVSMAGNILVKFRESRHNLSRLMKNEGYDYQIYKPFIDSFESKLMDQHYDALDKK